MTKEGIGNLDGLKEPSSPLVPSKRKLHVCDTGNCLACGVSNTVRGGTSSDRSAKPWETPNTTRDYVDTGEELFIIIIFEMSMAESLSRVVCRTRTAECIIRSHTRPRHGSSYVGAPNLCRLFRLPRVRCSTVTYTNATNHQLSLVRDAFRVSTRFVSLPFALSLASCLPRLAPYRCAGFLCLGCLGYNSTTTLSIRSRSPHDATTCMGNMLTGMLSTMAIVPRNPSGKITLRIPHFHKSMTPLSGAVVQNLRAHLVDVSVVPLTTGVAIVYATAAKVRLYPHWHILTRRRHQATYVCPEKSGSSSK